MDVREKLEVIAHLGDHITYKEDIGICYDSALAKVIEDAYMELKNGVTVQEWIPVTERLPEDDLPKTSKRKMIRCLVYTDKGTVKPCVRQRCISRKVDGEWVYTPWEWNKDIFAKPTHWMPLPEPPKGE